MLFEMARASVFAVVFFARLSTQKIQPLIVFLCAHLRQSISRNLRSS